jgi:hypothetical protein
MAPRRAVPTDRDRQLATNLAYATAVAGDRFRGKDPLPGASDIDALGGCYKFRFNRPGKGDPGAWSARYRAQGSPDRRTIRVTSQW